MKKLFKLFGIIAFAAVIGFSITACDELFGPNEPVSNCTHTWNDGIVTTPPTSTATGIRTFTCTQCSATKTETIPTTAANPTINIKNDTGYSIPYLYIKPSTATNWGSDRLGASLSNGTSRTFTLSEPLSANSVYDIRLLTSTSSSGISFRKYMVTVSSGMTITFTADDLNDGSNLPTITIQNRSGVSFNGLYIKPSVSSDWGTSFGSISNNSNLSATIPIPPSSYTEFDIQMRSTNPANTYTRNNVSVYNGMTLTYTSADSDNPLTTMPIIVIQNDTGYSIPYLYIKPSTATNWGSDRLGATLSNGTSRTFTLSESLSANNVYDIRLLTSTSSSGISFRKYMVTVSEGMIITLTVSDMDDGSNLPSITIQNRSGVTFNSVHIKPSSSSDWGTSFGPISNNSNLSATIPIPPSSYTEFDIQMRSTNPANTYTRYNVTVSNGMVLTYTSADSDNPLTGNPIIVIQNDTGYSISNVYIKPSTSDSWGYAVSSATLADGASRAITLSQSLSANSVYDIRLTRTGSTFVKNSVTVSDGMVVIFTNSDLE